MADSVENDVSPPLGRTSAGAVGTMDRRNRLASALLTCSRSSLRLR